MAITNYIDEGKVTSPVVVKSVADYLNSDGTGALAAATTGSVCSSVRINKWSKCKPYSRDVSYGPLDDAYRKECSWGLQIPYLNLGATLSNTDDASLNTMTQWKHIHKPTGGSVSPYRLSDFNGYVHTPVPTVTLNISHIEITTDADYIDMNMTVNTANNGCVKISDMQLSFIPSRTISQCYFGMALFSASTGKLVYIMTDATQIGNTSILSGRYSTSGVPAGVYVVFGVISPTAYSSGYLCGTQLTHNVALIEDAYRMAVVSRDAVTRLFYYDNNKGTNYFTIQHSVGITQEADAPYYNYFTFTTNAYMQIERNSISSSDISDDRRFTFQMLNLNDGLGYGCGLYVPDYDENLTTFCIDIAQWVGGVDDEVIHLCVRYEAIDMAYRSDDGDILDVTWRRSIIFYNQETNDIIIARNDNINNITVRYTISSDNKAIVGTPKPITDIVVSGNWFAYKAGTTTWQIYAVPTTNGGIAYDEDWGGSIKFGGQTTDGHGEMNVVQFPSTNMRIYITDEGILTNE